GWRVGGVAKKLKGEEKQNKPEKPDRRQKTEVRRQKTGDRRRLEGWRVSKKSRSEGANAVYFSFPHTSIHLPEP
ncbi:MAG TPA: hypothetical protein PLA81_09145, partial [Syntrophorhabdaceae bacterium]|nr:hypothetical protein [Syntrophorhabdaceae bacterium]HPL41738.1 hypothetical protein [Syntrophorhabdaceae bacterium]